jgi:hypothetical protein
MGSSEFQEARHKQRKLRVLVERCVVCEHPTRKNKSQQDGDYEFYPTPEGLMEAFAEKWLG